jgi:uncharacterized membrane protein YsdA (DUF1294 family)
LLAYVLIAVAVVNVVTFAAFGIDKWKARRDRRRISEARLLGLAFATGLLGAWLGMRVFRHKTRKTSFKVKLWVVTVLNPAWLLVLAWSRGDLS